MKATLNRIHRDDRGAMSMDSMLIMALVVIPFVTLLPLFYRMIRIYTYRITDIVGLPFP